MLGLARNFPSFGSKKDKETEHGIATASHEGVYEDFSKFLKGKLVVDTCSLPIYVVATDRR